MTKDDTSLLASISSKFDNHFMMKIDPRKQRKRELPNILISKGLQFFIMTEKLIEWIGILQYIYDNIITIITVINIINN